MSTLSLGVVTPSENITISVTVADDDMTRIITAYRAAYGQIADTDEDGNPVMRDRTDTEVIQAAITGIMNGVLANVQAYEQSQAASTAAATVQPITVTPINE